MDGLLHLVQRGGDWAGCGPSRPLLAVPNVTVHPSTATVPITVLLYDGPLLWGFNMAIKGLTEQRSLCPEFYNVLFLRFSRSLHIYTTSAMPDCGPLYCCLFVLALRLDVGWDSDADRWWGAQTGWWCRCVCVTQGGADHLFLLKKRVVTVPKLQKEETNDLVRYNTQYTNEWSK